MRDPATAFFLFIVVALLAFLLGLVAQAQISVSFGEIEACVQESNLKHTGGLNFTGNVVVDFNIIDGQMTEVKIRGCNVESDE